jgi:hypothetical protein
LGGHGNLLEGKDAGHSQQPLGPLPRSTHGALLSSLATRSSGTGAIAKEPRPWNDGCCELLAKPFSREIQMATSKSDGGPLRQFVDIQRSLKGASYPADKTRLRETAASNGADDDVLQALDALPEQQYGSPAEVSKALGQEE